jgi:hypothetical protein
MPEDIEYQVLTGQAWRMDKAVEHLENHVREAISQGWRPLGGVNAVALPENQPPEPYYYCHQAMVRKFEKGV